VIADIESTLTPRTLVMRRQKIREYLLEAHALLFYPSSEDLEGVLFPVDRRRRLIAITVRVLQLATEGWAK
jgi:hypothetical protein